MFLPKPAIAIILSTAVATDTFFDDPDVPSSDAGFFYLRSVVDAGGEGGLGTATPYGAVFILNAAASAATKR
jgi:hypothetical protein